MAQVLDGDLRGGRADRVRNRERIVAAAAREFAVTGVQAQMDDIAARAGLAVGTLYRHFDTKEALMAAIVERRFREILELVRRAGERADEEPFAVLSDVLRQRTEAIAGDAAARTSLTVAADADAVRQAVAGVIDEIRAALQVLVDRARAAGAIRTDIDAGDIWIASCGVCAMMDGTDAWRRHLGIVLDGLRPRDAHR